MAECKTYNWINNGSRYTIALRHATLLARSLLILSMKKLYRSSSRILQHAALTSDSTVCQLLIGVPACNPNQWKLSDNNRGLKLDYSYFEYINVMYYDYNFSVRILFPFVLLPQFKFTDTIYMILISIPTIWQQSHRLNWPFKIDNTVRGMEFLHLHPIINQTKLSSTSAKTHSTM